ncbi:MAG: DUF58 domain-containing protein [Acidimicrobiales bacterium]|nr:DUF58 domain-containing protein [Acidimicrobiales bacterium]
MSPTRRAALVVAAVAVAAVVVPVPIAVLVMLGVLAAIAVDAFSVRDRVLVTRTLAPVVSRGIASEVAVVVDGDPRGSIEIRQPVPTDIRLEPDTQDEQLEARLTPQRRGRYVVPAPVVRRTGPLGLGRWDRAAELDDSELAVFPDLVNARRLVLRVRKGRFGSAGRQARGPLGLGTEFELIREYAPDDDIRQVNWRATARVGRPMSNQYRVEQDRDLHCLVDTGRLMTAPVGDRSRIDVALDALTALGLVADELGDRFGVVAFDAEVHRHLPPRRNGGETAVRACFDLEARSVDTDYERAFQLVAGTKRSMMVLVTDLLDESAASSLVAAMPTLVRRHAVVVASVQDPALRSVMQRDPSSAVDVYEASVGAAVLAAKARTAARLRASGATVIEASPTALPAACVDAYLSLKSRARL